MARWPAWFLKDPFDYMGTAYIKPLEFEKKIEAWGKRGRAWKYRKQFTTYMPNRDLSYKNLIRLGPDSEEDFWHIMGSCRNAGVKPPSSFNDIFLSLYSGLFPRITPIAPFRGEAFGGWQAVIRRGEYKGKVYHYDLNKAYRWAAEQGLPRLHSYRVIKDYSWSPAVYKVVLRANVLPYAPWPGEHMITSEERDRLDIKPEAVLYGVGFRDEWINLQPIFKKIEESFPYCKDRISRAFWGAWNTEEGVVQISWGPEGKPRVIKNPRYNPIWAAFITSRVKLRLLEYLSHTLHVFVDSILSTEEIPTGERVGEFRLKGVHEKGIWIKSPGFWGEGNFAIKHAGLREGDMTHGFVKI